jgi:hypothetical protein
VPSKKTSASDQEGEDDDGDNNDEPLRRGSIESFPLENHVRCHDQRQRCADGLGCHDKDDVA